MDRKLLAKHLAGFYNDSDFFGNRFDNQTVKPLPWTRFYEVVADDFQLGFGSTVQNPNPRYVHIPKGSKLLHDSTAPNGNVWFYVETGHRGLSMAGSERNLIKNKQIRLI